MKRAFLMMTVCCVVLIAFLRIELIAKEPTTSDAIPKKSDGSVNVPVEKADKTIAPPTDGATNEVSQKDLDELVNAALKAYTSTRAAFDADSVPLDSVLDRSEKLLEAQLIAARNSDERIAAFQDCVDRTKNIVDRIKALYDQGGKGGELNKYWPARYHYLDAQRRLSNEKAGRDSGLGAKRIPIQERRRLAQERHDELVKMRHAASNESIDRSSLRYDGKSFEQWRNELLTELRTETRTAALQAFKAFGTRGYGVESAKAIVEIMGDYRILTINNKAAEGQLAETAVSAIGEIPPDLVIPVLIEALVSTNDNQRAFAAAMFTEIRSRPKSAVPALLKAMSDPFRDVRLGAMRAMNVIDRNNEQFLPAVRKVLKEEDRDLVLEAIYVLVPSKGKNIETLGAAEPIVQDLIELLEGDDSPMQACAFGALQRLGPNGKSAIPVMLKWLASGDANHQARAMAILGAIGPDAKEAIPALENASHNEKIKENAVRALDAIRGESTPEPIPPASRNAIE